MALRVKDSIQKLSDSYERFFDYDNGVPRWRQIGEIAALGGGLIVTGVLTRESAPIAFGGTVDGIALAMAGCRAYMYFERFSGNDMAANEENNGE
jgi:hypothetical protein